MYKAFIKQNGVVKEVLISAIKCDYDKENNVVSVTTTKCLHQGEEIGWGKRTYYKDKLCTETFSLSNISFAFTTGGGMSRVSGLLDTFAVHYNENGARAVTKVFVKEITYLEPDNIDSTAQLSKCEDGSPLVNDKVFWDEKTYNFHTETTIHHNDGSVEVFGGDVKNWAFSEKQSSLIEQFIALQKEMKDNKIRLVFDGDSWDLLAVNEEHMQIAVNNPCGDGEEIEGCSEWDEVPYLAQRKFPCLWTNLSYDDSLHCKKRENQ